MHMRFRRPLIAPDVAARRFGGRDLAKPALVVQIVDGEKREFFMLGSSMSSAFCVVLMSTAYPFP